MHWFTKLSGKLWGLIVAFSVFVTIASGWGSLKQVITDVQNGVTSFGAAVIEWITTPVLLPLWVFFLLLLFVFASVLRLIIAMSKSLRQPIEPELKRVKFRDLWLFIKIDFLTSVPTVMNRNVRDARCGECMGLIKSTDAVSYGGEVNYLRCENGHYVGNKMQYAEFQRIIDEKFEQAEKDRKEREERAEQAHQQLLKDIDEGKISKEEYNKWLGSTPASPAAYAIPYIVVPEEEVPPTSAQAFYDRVIRDYEQSHLRQSLEKVEVLGTP
jgi:hypothetical protein